MFYDKVIGAALNVREKETPYQTIGKDEPKMAEKKERKITFLETSEMHEFNGDIIITDPCYLEDYPYRKVEKTGMCRDTIYGDWGCTVYDSTNGTEKGKPVEIGQFCADAGQVCVCPLDAVLNDRTKEYIYNRPWTRTIITNFKGIVKFNIYEEEYEWEGKMEKEPFLQVEGFGIKDGKPFRFFSTQTSL